MTRSSACVNGPHAHRYIILAAVAWLPIVGFLAFSLTWLSPGSNSWLAALATLLLNLAAVCVAALILLRYQWALCVDEDHVRLRRWADYATSRSGRLVARSELRRIIASDPRTLELDLASGERIKVATLLWTDRDFDALAFALERFEYKTERLRLPDHR